MTMVSPRHQPVSSSSMGSMDDFLNLDMTSSSASAGGVGDAGDFYSDLFPSPSPHLSDVASPSSATTFLPTTPPLQALQPQTAMDTIDISNHTVFSDLYRTYIEPLQSQTSTKNDYPNGLGNGTGAMGPGAFSFNDLFASYAAAASASSNSTVNGANNTSMNPSETLLPQTSTTVGGVMGASNGATTTMVGGFPFTIDPQLVATPALQDINSTSLALPTPTKPTTLPTPIINKSAPRAPTASIDEDDEDEDDDEEDEDEDMLPKGKGGKGKKLSGGVSTGGIVKRTGATSCVVRDADSNDPDDWRPSPEEYKKLSSKEKRQLRNKISARNFRVRRKEYITTLENQISDRDKLIDAIRDELGAQQLQNSELRQEIDALKKAMLDGRHPHPVGLPPPTPLAALSPPNKKSTKSALAKANPNKDVAAAAGGSSKGFWGGAHNPMGMGGITPVHSAFSILPDGAANLASVLSGKGAGYTISTMPTPIPPPMGGPGAKWLAALQDNINPQLNVHHRGSTTPPSSSSSSGSEGAASPVSSSSGSGSSLSSPQTPPAVLPQQQVVQQQQQQQQQWNGYSDINPFTIKTLDSYRLQLWAKMAQDSAQQAQSQQQQAQVDLQLQQQQMQQQNLFNTFYSSGLSGGMKPHYFSTPASKDVKQEKENVVVPKGAPLSAVLAGKAAASLSSSSSLLSPTIKKEPTTSPLLASSSSLPSVASAQATLAATAISHSIVSRMGSAFWDAFSASSSSLVAPSSHSVPVPTRNWDMDKVQRVLEGKAVLKVVDVEGPPTAATMAAADLGLEEKMGAMNIGGSSKQSQTQPTVWGCAGQRRSTTVESWVGGASEKKRILGS
ncbi:hypothetical protein FRB96_004422 [Tulasnella sp. 330]|nr:hypothetical protein FRB96_004422 [Tulasnella sp. 330]